MFEQKRLISDPRDVPPSLNQRKTQKHVSSVNGAFLQEATKPSDSHPLGKNSAYDVIVNMSVPSFLGNKTNNLTSVVTAPLAANAVGINSVQTYRIGQAFEQLRTSIISRGTQYTNNSEASRRGYIAENFTAESYNVDATIKRISDRAVVPDSHQKASPDIIYDHGKKQASLKFYMDAEASAKAQTNPEYGEQVRIVPADQLEDGKAKLGQLAKKNEAKGRTEAANIQKNTAKRMAATIKGSEGAESTALTKNQADEMSRSFTVDEKGNKKVNEARLDKAIEDTGLTKKVKNAKFTNELRGVGIAAAIGLGTGFALGFVVSLAQNGLNPESLKNAFVCGVKQGGISAVVAAGSAAISMTVGATVGGTIGTQIIANLGTNVAQKTAEKIYEMCNTGVVGLLTITAFSVYEFTKLKINHYGTKECLIRVGKSAALSLSVLIVSMAASYYWPTVGGIVVSVVSGVIMTGYSIYSSVSEKETMREITFYSIELCRPTLATA